MSPRTEDQNQRIRDERREQILQAALSVFAQKGWAAAKIGDVAKEAGLSHGLVYHYFASKDEIFAELVQQALKMSTEIFLQGAEMQGTPWERLTAMTETVIPNAYRGTSPYYFLIMIQAFTSEAVPPKVKELVKELSPRYVESLIPVLIKGQETGEVALGDPYKMATAYFALIQGLAIAQIQGGEDMVIPDPEVVLRLFKGEQSSPAANELQEAIESSLFKTVLPNRTALRYRTISPEADPMQYEVKIESEKFEGQEAVRIGTFSEHQRLIAYVRPDWRPMLVETCHHNGELINRIKYGDDRALFENSKNEQKKIKVSGEFFDSNTIFQFLAGYPFKTSKKIAFDLVIDGKGGSPLGSFKMSVQEIGREEVQTEAGVFDCYKLEMGVAGLATVFASKYKSYFWYSVDIPHFLVRYEDSMGRITELIP